MVVMRYAINKGISTSRVSEASVGLASFTITYQTGASLKVVVIIVVTAVITVSRMRVGSGMVQRWVVVAGENEVVGRLLVL